MDIKAITNFDIRGVNPANKVVGEKVLLSDKTCPWIIPNGAPFFADYVVNGVPIVVVYNAAGGELVRDRDYFVEESFIPLVEVTGRPIKCFIRVTQAILDANTHVTINYQSTGAFFVVRNGLQDILDALLNKNKAIDWNTIIGIPVSFTASHHWHRIQTEIGDWFELTQLFVYLAGNIGTRDPSLGTDIDTAIAAAFNQLYTLRNQQQARLNTHNRNYSKPHNPVKADIGLGAHPNYATATLDQHREGTAANLLATPEGVQELMKGVTVDTSSSMEAGILAFSKFGSGDFIPPAISGSFGGLGARSEVAGICVEPDGRLMLLQNHYDGKTDALFFSTLDDYKKPYNQAAPYQFTFTGFQYQPQSLASIGVTPNTITNGSGNDIIFVGKTTKNPKTEDRWFLALTNNTFDPTQHNYIETDMSEVFATIPALDSNGTTNDLYYWGRMTVHLLEEWALLLVEYSPGGNLGSSGRFSMFRIPKVNLLNGTKGKWSLIKLTFKDWDETQYTDSTYWQWATKQVTGNNVTKWGRYTFNPTPIPQNTPIMSRRLQNLIAKNPDKQSKYFLNLFSWASITYGPAGKPIPAYNSYINMVYEFDPNTGLMTTVYKQPPINCNYDVYNVEEVQADANLYAAIWGNAVINYRYPCATILPNGDRLLWRVAGGQEATPLNSIFEYRTFAIGGQPVTSKLDVVKDTLSNARLTSPTGLTKYRNLATPYPVGLGGRWMATEADGENWLAYPVDGVSPTAGFALPKIYHRKVTGPYAVRPEVPNQDLGEVYARPLSNDMYLTNMSYTEGVITMTGSDVELDSKNVDSGTMNLSVCGWSSKSNATSQAVRFTIPGVNFRTTLNGAWLTFPRTYSKAVNPVNRVMTYTPTSFYGINASLRDKIKALIPTEFQGDWWMFTMFMLDSAGGGMFTGHDTAVIQVKFRTIPSGDVASTWESIIFHVRPVIEQPNAAHPNYHLITDFTVLSSSVRYYVTVSPLPVTVHGYAMYEYFRPTFTGYKDGNTLKCVLFSGFSVSEIGQKSEIAVFDINLTTNAISGLGRHIANWDQGERISAIPRVGRSQYTNPRPDTNTPTLSNIPIAAYMEKTTGSAARVFPVDDGAGNVKNYLTSVTYPRSGWTVFFSNQVEVLISGMIYYSPIVSINLDDITANPSNKTFWVYITVEDQQCSYVISDVKLRHSGRMMHVATITTGASLIDSIESRQPFMIGDLELSYTRTGGTIPVSSGLPQDDGTFAFLKQSELLP